MAVTFNGVQLHIHLDETTTFYHAGEIYSRWKEWVLQSDNAKFPPAFRVVGGDPVGEGTYAPAFYFVRNDLGWRIQKPSANIEIVINGNIVGESVNTPIFADPDNQSTLPAVVVNRTEVTSVDLTEVWRSVITSIQDPGTAAYIIQRILDIVEADEIFTPTTATKYKRGTTDILLQKNASGNVNLTGPIYITE